MAKYLIQRLDGTLDGPFTSAELKERAQRGLISPADRIAAEGTDRWVPAMRVNGIHEILESRALASPPPAVEPESIPLLETPTPRASAPPAVPTATAIPLPADGVPRYGVLRCVAGWVITYGWLIIASGFASSYFMAVMQFRSDQVDGGRGTPWSGGMLAIVVLLCIGAGVATAFAIHAVARRSGRLNSAFALIVLLPAIPFALQGAQKGAVNPVELAALLWVIGYSLVTLIVGAIVVAIGEFLVAHADIASNSWYGRAAPRG